MEQPTFTLKSWFRKSAFFFLGIYATCLSWLRPFQRLGKPVRSALFVPPDDSPGSLGDEAMLVGAIQFLRDQGFQTIGIVSWGTVVNWDYLKPIDQVVRMSDRVVGHLAFIQAVSGYSHLYCTGADMMDGYYSNHATLRLLKLADLAARTGAQVSFMGFSFNEHPTPTAVQAIATLPDRVRLCCRDPFSYQRLLQRVQRPITLVADVAFLLQPAQNSDLVSRIQKWVQAQQANGRVVIGINLNNLFLRDRQEFNAAALVEIYVAALTELFAQNPRLSFLMVPHDMRGSVSDVSLAADLLAALPTALQPYCTKVPFPCSAAEIKAICADLDLVLTGRMHLAIACLGQGTPVAGVTYQGKFEGLFHDFGLTGMTIAPDLAFQPGQLAQFFGELIPKRQSLRQQIQAARPTVQQLSAKNFANAVPSGGRALNSDKRQARSSSLPLPSANATSPLNSEK